MECYQKAKQFPQQNATNVAQLSKSPPQLGRLSKPREGENKKQAGALINKGS